MMPRWPTRTPAERARAKTRLEDRGHDTPCRVFTGCTNPDGYGVVNVEGSGRLAHKVIYEDEIGAVPAGLQLDHRCRVPACCEPSHLEPVTNRVNTLRGIGPTAVNAKKEQCVHGHEFTPENTRIVKATGYRRCRACHRIREAQRRARRTA